MSYVTRSTVSNMLNQIIPTVDNESAEREKTRELKQTFRS